MRTFISTLVAFFIGTVFAAQTQAQSSQDELWRTVAQSRLILVGTFQATSSDLSDPVRRDGQSYVPISVEVEEVLFGTGTGNRVTVRHLAGDPAYLPSDEDVLSLSSRRALLFLISDRYSEKYYFAGWSDEGLRPASDELVATIRAEVERQAAVLKNWQVNPKTPHFKEVGTLIERVLASGAQDGTVGSIEVQEAAFREIEALGLDAVEAIVAQMDDRRPLPRAAISLVNKSPDAFEGMRHYSPDVVVDALAAILNQLTGESFGFIYNGDSEAERTATVNGWRIYVDQLKAEAEPK